MTQLDITLREWDEAIMEHRTPKWGHSLGCQVCCDPFRMIEVDGEEIPCPNCNKSGDRGEREYQAWKEEA